jgi:hypothetical protein
VKYCLGADGMSPMVSFAMDEVGKDFDLPAVARDPADL